MKAESQCRPSHTALRFGFVNQYNMKGPEKMRKRKFALSAEGVSVYKYRDEDFRLSVLLPGETEESLFLIPEDLKAGDYTVQLRFVNPAEGVSKKVIPLRLSNDREIRDGFYELAKVTIV